MGAAKRLELDFGTLGDTCVSCVAQPDSFSGSSDATEEKKSSLNWSCQLHYPMPWTPDLRLGRVHFFSSVSRIFRLGTERLVRERGRSRWS